ncbi:UDP-forming cellulose synthase catalytic subunit [Variovorax guangxiensis]|uniref:Cellulose synthase catalytic subunit [UDP-forming] n=1 Tax=Variovorax guangxiensis TaxID=1775474 RepID=A0A502DLK6_9BURK|nr:UDP-forming cellulose synthase catalytic subunit [Variovorax guangxiensis]TPG22056.1 UDP-forming cellulose synthase catalytic subunit [Variovorax ginsengisoli]TPG25944.1 UDP-forming cellulose synthase catalytic subunit [Variovorax guangxiensis]
MSSDAADIHPDDTLLGRHPLLRAAAWLVTGVLLVALIIAPLTLQQQLTLSVAIFIAALVINRFAGRFGTLAMIFLSVVVSSRYMYWRLTETMVMDNPLDLVLGIGLLVAEVYAFVVLLLGYVQTAWPLERKPVAMPADTDAWPTVDLFIPTYNESLSVVRATVLAAQSIDWPRDKLKIFVLDDGRREEFRVFCEAVGVQHVTRDNNRHAKAGNINAALKNTTGEFIAIFDCDHIPTRSFLQIAMGWFGKDAKLGMVQTPHYFFSADPFEKNLGTFGTVPNEGELFYGLIQDGNDLWNATFFCGSCAVLRRTICEEVGGIAVETVTEDAHTALKMHRLGYNTAYLALPQAAGLATESLSGHVGQRIRWARGMAQIFRIDNPLFGRGLKWAQRLCYVNAMLHFLYGLPRLIYLTAPLAYLFFGASVIHASASMIFAYALPHIFHANLTNSRIQGRFRYLFWNEVYEAVLAWYIFRPTLVALINPKLGSFNVTAKGGLIQEEYFDTTIAKASLFLLALNFMGVAAGLWRLTFVDADNIATVWLNLAWTFYNLVILGACVAAANETRQLRNAHRIALQIPATLYFADGHSMRCETYDFSTGGLGVDLPIEMPTDADAPVTVALYRGDNEFRFPATVRFNRGQRMGLAFAPLSFDQERALVQCTTARADIWAARWGNHPRAAVHRVIGHIARISAIGFKDMFAHYYRAGLRKLRPAPRVSHTAAGAKEPT